MDAILGILNTLKLDNTIWIQFGCFTVAYLAMSQLLFKPYYQAYVKRKERTVGGEENAEQMLQEAAVITENYENRLREINGEYKTIYDQEKTEAQRAFNAKVAEARKEAEAMTEQVREKISAQVKEAQKDVEKEISSVSAAMASHLIGKEVH